MEQAATMLLKTLLFSLLIIAEPQQTPSPPRPTPRPTPTPTPTAMPIPTPTATPIPTPTPPPFYPHYPHHYPNYPVPTPPPPPVCRPVDLVFVLHTSGSMGIPDTVLNFVVDVVSMLTIGPDDVRVGLVVDAMVEFDLSQGQFNAFVVDVINTLPPPSGGTSIAQGLATAREQVFGAAGNRPTEPDVLVLIADGGSNHSQALAEASLAKAVGIDIISVGIFSDSNSDRNLLKQISSTNTVLEVSDFATLADIVSELTEETCDLSDDCPSEGTFDPVNINDTVGISQLHVMDATQIALDELFQSDVRRTPRQLLSLFKYPKGKSLELTLPAEIFDQVVEELTLQSRSQSESFVLQPAQASFAAHIAGCQGHEADIDCTLACFQECRTFDGSCNNIEHSSWGAINTHLRRFVPPCYDNGFNLPRTRASLFPNKLPSARLVSTQIASTTVTTDDVDVTHMLMQWGQFLDHDLTLVPIVVAQSSYSDGGDCGHPNCSTSAPCFPIPVPNNDTRIMDHDCIGFTRSSSVCIFGTMKLHFPPGVLFPGIHREQINSVTGYLDASNVYGSSELEANDLRDLTSNGLLKTGAPADGVVGGKPLLPFNTLNKPIACEGVSPISNCFLAGDVRANEQLGLLSIHTIWTREHNRIATELHLINPGWNGDQLFQQARKIVGAEMQHITCEHFLPLVLGPAGTANLGGYNGYNPGTDASIINSFATAAYRFGHSLINPILTRFDSNLMEIAEGHVNLHDAFFRPDRIVTEGGIDPVLRGLFVNCTKKLLPMEMLNDDLTERLFEIPGHLSLDLAALNIQRGRDHGLGAYNDYREACGMVRAATFSQFSTEISDAAQRQKLASVYAHPDDVDLFIGGLAEDALPGARIGPTFICILAEQFRRTREGDRFWYENPSFFSALQLQELQKTTLARVICDNSDGITRIPANVFVKTDPNDFVDCSSLPEIDLLQWDDGIDDCANTTLQWSAWGDCSKTCDEGQQIRSSRCPAILDGHIDENNTCEIFESRKCELASCQDMCVDAEMFVGGDSANVGYLVQRDGGVRRFLLTVRCRYADSDINKGYVFFTTHNDKSIWRFEVNTHLSHKIAEGFPDDLVGIGLDTKNELIFVSAGKTGIWSVTYAGNNMINIVNTQINDAPGIATNPDTRMLYWVNEKRKRLEEINYSDLNNPTGRQIIKQFKAKPRDVLVDAVDSCLYVIFENGLIIKISLSNTQEVTEITDGVCNKCDVGNFFKCQKTFFYTDVKGKSVYKVMPGSSTMTIVDGILEKRPFGICQIRT